MPVKSSKMSSQSADDQHGEEPHDYPDGVAPQPCERSSEVGAVFAGYTAIAQPHCGGRPGPPASMTQR